MKILIADDSRVMRTLIIRALRQSGFAGHDVVEAADGQDALRKVHTEVPDLVLSCWNLPGMSGIDVLETLRANGSTVRFGFVTAERSPEVRERAERSGALFLVTKPFTTESFEQALAPVLG